MKSPRFSENVNILCIFSIFLFFLLLLDILLFFQIEFRVKCGIGVGKIYFLIVGGKFDRCEYLICGDGLIQAFDCENDCDPELDRMVIISEKAAAKEGVANNFELRKVDGSDRGNLEVMGKNKRSRGRRGIDRKHYGHMIPDEENGLADKLANYVPAAVKPHLDMPQQIWTGELRPVSIVFVSLPWNARTFHKFSEKILEQLQKIIFTLQVWW